MQLPNLTISLKRGLKDAYKRVVALIFGNCSSKMHINVEFLLPK